MIYLDANFFIFAVLDTSEKGSNASKIQKDIIEGNLFALTSSLALDEVMWSFIKNKKFEILRPTIEEIYSMKNLTIEDMNSAIPLLALDFMEKYNLKPRDAFHVAIMKSFGINEIVSDDPDFDKVEWIKRIKI
jgi:predicted nucleic acid-binding protein